ncbi:MAG: D-glycero-beta-D-manno-heptose-7-phosphate kinase [Alphaproteobacteria bacterium]
MTRAPESGATGTEATGTSAADLLAALHALTDVPVLVVGDAMIDRYVYGEAERISPEAPVPVIRVVRETAVLGGAGNVARNLAALGAAVRFVAAVGDDAQGEALQRLLAAEPGVAADLAVVSGRPTTLKTRYVAGGQQLLRADRESTAPIDGAAGRRLVEAAEAAMPACRAVVLSDYGKGVLTPPLIATIVAAAHAAGRPVVVDPKGRDYRRYRGAAVATPNRRELAEASGMPVGDDAEIAAAARAVMERSGIASLLVTRSQEGASLVTPDAVEHLSAEARDVWDVSGAGDTVVAATALVLGAGYDLPVAARLANIAAGIAVGKAGTATVEPRELEAALRRADLLAGGNKIVHRDTAARTAAAWRAEGLRVAFTNGCFDLLHPGHVGLLAQARARCDRLIVGLNSDASTRRLKGETRPVQTETARALVLASMANVDLVVVFDEDTPLNLLQAIRPHLLVKGADYSLEQVVGGEEVRAWGGQVYLAQLAEGHSTTRLVSTIRR